MQTEPNTTIRLDYYGNMVDMQIVPNEGKFGLLYRDQLIAEIANNEEWQQVSGESLPRFIFESVVDKIITFYE
jgi:hypothetical protein